MTPAMVRASAQPFVIGVSNGAMSYSCSSVFIPSRKRVLDSSFYDRTTGDSVMMTDRFGRTSTQTTRSGRATLRVT